MNDRDINHLIATELLGWGYSHDSKTYWLEMGCPIGTASSFDPLRNEFQGNKVISELGLDCTRDNLKEYVCSLTQEERTVIREKYGPIQRKQSGIKYLTFRNGQWVPLD